MDIKQIRIDNLILLTEKFGRNVVAEKMGYEDTNYLNQLCRGHGSFGSRTARKIEVALGMTSGWMDVAHPDIRQELASPPLTGKADDQSVDKFKVLLKLTNTIADFTPTELLELEAQAELILRRKNGGF